MNDDVKLLLRLTILIKDGNFSLKNENNHSTTHLEMDLSFPCVTQILHNPVSHCQNKQFDFLQLLLLLQAHTKWPSTIRIYSTCT